jgi:hypothetical protein
MNPPSNGPRVNPIPSFAETSGGKVEVPGGVEDDAGDVGANFFAADLAFRHAADHDQFRLFRIDAPDIAGYSVAGVEHILMIYGDAFDDDRLSCALWIEIDEHGSFVGVGIPGREENGPDEHCHQACVHHGCILTCFEALGFCISVSSPVPP